MSNDIKLPIFIVADDGDVKLLHELWEVNCCGIEPIDVADNVYSAYDSEGQMLKLVTINEKNGKIERPTEDTITIPLLGKIIGIAQDRVIEAIPQEIKDTKKLTENLVQGLSQAGYKIENLKLEELVEMYKENKKRYL